MRVRFKRTCDDCSRELSRSGYGPMLWNDVWLSIAEKRDVLCLDCTKSRVRERLDRNLTLQDLMPVPFNRNHVLSLGSLSKISPEELVILWNALTTLYMRDQTKELVRRMLQTLYDFPYKN